MKYLLSATCAALLAGLFALPASAEEVTLRGVNAFAKGTTFARPFEQFIDYVNEHGKGVLQINYVGGPEAVPPFELGNAVQSGVVDIANSTSAYYTNLIPEGDALHLSTVPMQEQRTNGCYEIINKLHEEKMNAHYLARSSDGVPFHLYLTKQIDKPDLNGLTIRTTPVYRAFFEELGANLVRTAPGEVYTALERGSIDGYGWPVQGVLDLGWHERTKFRVDPGFYNADVNVLVNLDKWKSLSDEQRALLEEAAIWLEEKNKGNAAANEADKTKQAEVGIETITFSGEQADNWLKTAQDTGWAAVAEVNADLAGDLRACLTK